MMKTLKMKNIKILNSKILVFLAAAVVFVFILIAIFRTVWGGVRQPVAFNHKVHAENDLTCLDCHQYYEDHASSGRPILETCSGCHEEPLGESDAEAKVVEFVKSGKEIEWQRLYRVPEDVYFSHRQHVVLGNIACKSCHGDIGESSKPPYKPLKITMKKCLRCHEEKGASVDCIACHR